MFRIFGFVAALLFACSALAQVAYVHEMSGQVISRTVAGDRPLAVGSLLQQGDSVLTLSGSSAVIKFEDGQLMVMHERTEFRIAQYVYNKQNVSASSAIFDLVRGGLRFVTGVIGSTNRSSLQVRTATATIGIRGTDASVYFDAVTQAVTAAVNQGAVSLGTASVNPGNPMSAAPGLPPSPATQLTPVVQAALNQLSARTGLPLNTPVVVAASARAAAAQAAAQDLAARAQQNPALKAQADQAAADAAAALAAAIAAGQQAVQDALKAGATLPPPPAPPSTPLGDTSSGTSTGTTGTTSGSGSGSTGSGGGGSGTPQ